MYADNKVSAHVHLANEAKGYVEHQLEYHEGKGDTTGRASTDAKKHPVIASLRELKRACEAPEHWALSSDSVNLFKYQLHMTQNEGTLWLLRRTNWNQKLAVMGSLGLQMTWHVINASVGSKNLLGWINERWH